MNDFEVKTHIQDSSINGLFQEVNEIKKERSRKKEVQDQKTDKIIAHISEHGRVIAYKDDTAHVLSVKNAQTKKFDKQQLAFDMKMSTSELDMMGIAELVENKKITTDKLNEYYYMETKQVLRAKKATKKDLQLILGGS